MKYSRLIRLQKRAAHIVLKVDFSTPSQIMFNELKWLTFPKRVQYHTCIMMYKSLHGSAPEYLSNLFEKSSEVHSRNLRSVDNETLRTSYARTSIYDRSFSETGAKEWNSLPFNIKSSESFKGSRSKSYSFCPNFESLYLRVCVTDNCTFVFQIN